MIAGFRALGTTAVVAVADPAGLPAARATLARELAAVDRACSRFRADSELMLLNASAGCWVAVGALLFSALEAAVEAARETGGLVDPTVGRTLRLAGYDATYRVVARRDAGAFRARFARVAGWESVELDQDRRAVRVPVGVELDLGATAKALAADRGARTCSAAAGCGALVGLGGDFALAGEPPAAGWPIAFADDHTGSPEPGSTVALVTGGVATSSSMVRRWRSGSRDLHHVIDPRTGRPAVSCWRTVSVTARSCGEANRASTAALILAEDAESWLAARRLPARLVSQDGEVVCIAGWPSAEAAA